MPAWAEARNQNNFNYSTVLLIKNNDKEKLLIIEIYENTVDDLFHFLVSIRRGP